MFRRSTFASLFAAGLAVSPFIGQPLQAQLPPCSGPPGPPANFSALVSGSMLNLSWTTPVGEFIGSYIVEAGSVAGAADLARVDTESTATSFSSAVANGTYFMRARTYNHCGLSEPSNEVRTVVTTGTAKTLPNPTVMPETLTVTQDYSGDIFLMGTVRNGLGGVIGSFIKLAATFFGPAGEFVGTDTTYVEARSRRLKRSGIITDTTLAPWETGCFVMYTNTPRVRVHSWDLKTNFDNNETEALRGRVEVVGSLQQVANVFGDLDIGGLMCNAGTTLTYFNRFVVDVRNTEGRVLDCDYTYVNGSTVVLSSGVTTDTALQPGESGGFQTSTRAKSSEVARVRHWLQWDENQPTTTAQLSTSASVASALAEYQRLRIRLAELSRIDPRVGPRQDGRRLRDRVEDRAHIIEEQMRGGRR